MEAFEPPKYITSLIAAVNDGAKSAQLGALAFTAIGLFLLATAVSATDEDLLLNRALTISQLGGTAVPVVFAFGLAPAVFVAVHFYTLIRYDMLAGNIRRFVGDLAAIVPIEADRDRCRQLLANVEFVNVRAMPKGSHASSRMFNCTVRALLAGFPVAVLLFVQLQSLRLQSEWVSWTHHVCIFADLVLLVWFYGRLRGDDSWHFWRAPIRRTVALCWLPFAVLAVDLVWLEVPGPASRTAGQDLADYRSQYPKAPASFMEWSGWWASFQPIDLLLCTPGAWGCRFLTVTHRIIVGKVWDTLTFVALRAGADVDAKHLASFEVASLRNRTLRFADLTASELFAGDLTDTDLRQARLSYAQLQSASLSRADLSGANLASAQSERRQPDRRQPDRRQPDRRQPEQRPTERRPPERRPPDRCTTERRLPERRTTERRRRPDRRTTERRPPDRCTTERRLPEQRTTERRHRPDRRTPERRPPGLRPTERRRPEQRPTERRRPERRQPERRQPDRRPTERRQPERRQPERRRPEQRRPDRRPPGLRPTERRRPEKRRPHRHTTERRRPEHCQSPGRRKPERRQEPNPKAVGQSLRHARDAAAGPDPKSAVPGPGQVRVLTPQTLGISGALGAGGLSRRATGTARYAGRGSRSAGWPQRYRADVRIGHRRRCIDGAASRRDERAFLRHLPNLAHARRLDL